jgi:rRNA maturation protein Rpf1
LLKPLKQGKWFCLIFTCSRKASRKTIQLAKDLSKSFPGAFYWSRGKKSINELVEATRYEGVKGLIVLTEEHGNPVSLRLIEVKEDSWDYSEELRIALIKLRKDLSSFKSKLVSLKLECSSLKLKSFLKKIALFDPESVNVLKESKGVLSFYRNGKEIGPRLKLVN